MRTLIIAIIIIFTGCNQLSDEAQIIRDYVQTIDEGVRADLNFKLIELEYIEPVVASDSIDILSRQLRIDVIDSNQYLLDVNFLRDEEEYRPKFEANREFLETESNDFDQIFLVGRSKNKRLERFNQYQANPDSILGHIYRCEYEIDDPALNVRTTVTDQFLLNSDLTGAIRRID